MADTRLARRGARDPALIRADLERTRTELAEALLALRVRVSPRESLRRLVRSRPGAAVLVCFAVGYWLGKR